MAVNYTVAQGDHLSGIAHHFGFTDYLSIWNHPNNSGLKSQRQNPNVLLPGDILFVPDRETKVVPRAVDQRHKFVKKTLPLKLRLVLEDQFEKPIANAQCQLVLDGEIHQVTSDGEGKIEQDLSPDAHNASLQIMDPQTPFQGTVLAIKIGELDPADELSGQLVRLNNLGYFAGTPGVKDDSAFESAVEEFQCDNSLTVDGICGPATQAKLKQVHGC